MSIVKKLGEGYYGVDASNVSISQESLDRIREMSKYATSISNDSIQIREVGFAHFQREGEKKK